MEATHCNFCGKHRNYVRKLVSAVDLFNDKPIGICDECLILSFKAIKESDEKESVNVQSI